MEFDLAGKVIGLAMKVHSRLGPGYLESVYQNALAYELRRNAFSVETGVRLPVTYDSLVVGDFVADMIVARCLIVENKSVLGLAVAHEVQLVSYLTTTGIDEGLLLNFGSSRLEFKKKFRQPRPASKA